jgi:hypothetical protein
VANEKTTLGEDMAQAAVFIEEINEDDLKMIEE